MKNSFRFKSLVEQRATFFIQAVVNVARAITKQKGTERKQFQEEHVQQEIIIVDHHGVELDAIKLVDKES